MEVYVQRVLDLIEDPVVQRLIIQHLPSSGKAATPATAERLIASMNNLSDEEVTLMKLFGQNTSHTAQLVEEVVGLPKEQQRDEEEVLMEQEQNRKVVVPETADLKEMLTENNRELQKEINENNNDLERADTERRSQMLPQMRVPQEEEEEANKFDMDERARDLHREISEIRRLESEEAHDKTPSLEEGQRPLKSNKAESPEKEEEENIVTGLLDGSLAGGEAKDPADKVSDYVAALRRLWEIVKEGNPQDFQRYVMDPDQKSVKFPSTLDNLMQFTMADHDLSNTDNIQDGPTPDTLRKFSTKGKDYLKRKKLVAVLHARRSAYCSVASASTDLDQVVLPVVKLYLKRSRSFVSEAFKWARATPDWRRSRMQTLIDEADVFDLRMRFVMDNEVFDRREGEKHVGDYYRFVFMQRLVQEQSGSAQHVGMALESEPSRDEIDVPTMVAALIDMDPASPNRGFLIKAYQDKLAKDRTRSTVIELLQKAMARMEVETIRDAVVSLRSREARRRLYMVSKLSDKLVQELHSLPPGVFRNMGAN